MSIALLGTICLGLLVLSVVLQRNNRVLRRDKQAFRTLAENSPDLIFRYDRQGRRLYVNPAVGRLFGKPVEELIGESPADSPLLDPRQSRKLVDGIRRVFETGMTGGVEFLFADQEGRSRRQYTLLIPECDAEGRVNTVLGLWRDITAILEADRTVSNLLAQLPGFVFEFRKAADGFMSYPFASPRVEEFFGLRPEDIADDAAPVYAMAHPEDAPRILQAIDESARTLSCLRVQYRLLRPGYPERWMEVVADPEPEADGGVLWHGIQIDITERKRLEMQLAARERELRSLMENIPDNIARYTPDARHVYMSPVLERTNDKPKEYFLGRTPMECFPDGRYAEFERRVLTVAASGADDMMEMAVPMPDGTTGYHLIRFVAERDEKGAVVSVLSIGTDITPRKQMELALAASERELRTLMENIPANIARYTPDARHLYMSPVMERSLGIPKEIVLGRTLMECFPNERNSEYERRLLATAASGVNDEMETAVPTASGEVEDHLIRFVPERDEKGAVVSVLAIGTDITERKRAEENLRLAASVFTNTDEGIIITDADSRILDVNAAFARITGYTRAEVIGKNPSLLQSGRHAPEFFAQLWRTLERTGAWVGEIWNKRKNGEVYPQRLTISVVKDKQGKSRHYVGVFADITQIKEHEQQLQRIAQYDVLTGLPNRLLFMDRLKQAVALARRGGGLLAVCYGDLDGFKPVNDRFGHEAGDIVLVTVGERMQESVRAVDTVGRIGGDEFVILLLNLESVQQCEMILTRLLDAIAQPIRLDGHSASVTASLGVALFSQGDADPDTLLRQADQAMYQAKRSGKSIIRFFDPDRP